MEFVPLLGKSRPEVEGTIHAQQGPPELKRYQNGDTFINWKPLGLSIMFDGRTETLSNIFVYNNSDGFSQFRGTLPHGLTFAETNSDIVRRLGEPQTKGGRPLPVWIRYDHLDPCVQGKGSYGVVNKVKRKIDDGIYCMKQIDIGQLSRRERDDAVNEVRILASLNSPYVIHYFDSFVEPESQLNIVMEFAKNGNLCEYLKSEQPHSLPEDTVWKFFIQIGLGLHHIHSSKILHRDIKTLNIFLDADNTVKIGDLGVAKLMGTASFAHTLVGTPYYLSPELCENKPYNEKSDIWAYGCVLYELCTFRHPFDADNQGALVLKILRGRFRPLEGYSADLCDVVARCLTRDPRQRPTLDDLFALPALRRRLLVLGMQAPPPFHVPGQPSSVPAVIHIGGGSRPGTSESAGEDAESFNSSLSSFARLVEAGQDTCRTAAAAGPPATATATVTVTQAAPQAPQPAGVLKTPPPQAGLRVEEVECGPGAPGGENMSRDDLGETAMYSGSEGSMIIHRPESPADPSPEGSPNPVAEMAAAQQGLGRMSVGSEEDGYLSPPPVGPALLSPPVARAPSAVAHRLVAGMGPGRPTVHPGAVGRSTEGPLAGPAKPAPARAAPGRGMMAGSPSVASVPNLAVVGQSPLKKHPPAAPAVPNSRSRKRTAAGKPVPLRAPLSRGRFLPGRRRSEADSELAAAVALLPKSVPESRPSTVASLEAEMGGGLEDMRMVDLDANPRLVRPGFPTPNARHPPTPSHGPPSIASMTRPHRF
ncbi:putative Serine/threonine-protein kinase Nek8 [Paratrimastix pyriformis]|uniref:non-specific serine/threonine protein kinase n=1 Tax=Paratrimastix pyriformis TaxID=342808 RepID=A0ABQ8UUA2_9EUKA|nr:putative Serine/threonine-protein kinase Nek8 [Paratrimastix pyriformis]